MFCSGKRKCQTACKPGSVPSAASQAGMAIPLGRPLPNASCDRPERRRGDPPGIRGCLPLLFGLAPGGVFPAATVAGSAVRSYRTLSPLPPARPRPGRGGGVLSVALSLGLPPPGVTRHRASVEPGLSSPRTLRGAAIRPSGNRIIWDRLGKCQNLKKDQGRTLTPLEAANSVTTLPANSGLISTVAFPAVASTAAGHAK